MQPFPVVAVSNLIYEYPLHRALKGISFEIPAGSITALVGPNGAGKTTLLRCLAALEAPFSGTVEIFGFDSVESPREIQALVGYLPDFFGLNPDLTVRQSLTYAGMLRKISANKLKSRIEEVIERLALTAYTKKMVAGLSRGLQQRLAMAQSIIHHPKLLLLDEPASGLDPEARLSLSSLMKELQVEGATIIVSSHILSELEDYSEAMLTIHDGVVLSHDTVTAHPIDSSVMARESIVIGFSGDQGMLHAVLQQSPAIQIVQATSERFVVSLPAGRAHQAQLLHSLVTSGIAVHSFMKEEIRLQDLYLQNIEKNRSRGAAT